MGRYCNASLNFSEWSQHFGDHGPSPLCGVEDSSLQLDAQGEFFNSAAVRGPDCHKYLRYADLG